MKKITIVICAFLFLTTGFFCGCTQNSKTGLEHIGNINYIIGTWGNSTFLNNASGTSEYFLRIYNFTNNSYNYSYYTQIGYESYQSYSDGTYEQKDGNLILTNTTIDPPKKTTFRYSFSNDYSKLTLTDEFGQSIVYMK